MVAIVINNVFFRTTFLLRKFRKIIKDIRNISKKVLEEPVDLGLSLPKKVSLEVKKVYSDLLSNLMKFINVL